LKCGMNKKQVNKKRLAGFALISLDSSVPQQ